MKNINSFQLVFDFSAIKNIEPGKPKKTSPHFQKAWDLAKQNKENLPIGAKKRFYLFLATFSKCYGDIMLSQFQVAQKQFIKGDKPFKFYYEKVKETSLKISIAAPKKTLITKPVETSIEWKFDEISDTDLLIESVKLQQIFTKLSSEKALILAKFSLSSTGKKMPFGHYENTCKLFAGNQFSTIEECYENTLLVEKIMKKNGCKAKINSFGEVQISTKFGFNYIPVKDFFNYKFQIK